MVHIKFQGNWVSGSGEEDFLSFLPLWAWWPSWSRDLDQIYKFAWRLLTKSVTHKMLTHNGPLTFGQGHQMT